MGLPHTLQLYCFLLTSSPAGLEIVDCAFPCLQRVVLERSDVTWGTEGIEGTCKTTTEAAGKIAWEKVGGNDGAVTEGCEGDGRQETDSQASCGLGESSLEGFVTVDVAGSLLLTQASPLLSAGSLNTRGSANVPWPFIRSLAGGSFSFDNCNLSGILYPCINVVISS